jgi:hypothetical protein
MFIDENDWMVSSFNGDTDHNNPTDAEFFTKTTKMSNSTFVLNHINQTSHEAIKESLNSGPSMYQSYKPSMVHTMQS